MDPHNIDTSQGKMIAHASTKRWGRARWTEISVWHFADGIIGGKAWLAEVKACSTVREERTKTTRLASASLERALKIIDESDTGIAVRETAFEYAEDQGILPRTPGKQVVPVDYDAAIDWLYGHVLNRGEKLQAMADLDIYEEGGKLLCGIDKLLPFVDRKAFQAWVARQEKANA
jgi:hypothetical protein